MQSVSEQELGQIVKLCESIPEPYREKCFELLLRNALGGSAVSPEETAAIGEATQEASATAGEFILPIDVRAFLSQYGLDETMLWHFFIVEGSEIRPIYKLRATKKAKAQSQHALLMSLENALVSGQFEVGIETLRDRCKDQKTYDGANFMKNIKNNSTIFKEVDDVEVLLLSPDGKSELADLLEELSSAHG